MKDRNAGYIPDWGHGGKPVSTRDAEVGQPRSGVAPMAPVVHGLADQYNSEKYWLWAEVSGSTVLRDDGADEDGVEISGVEHWTRFNGHLIQIDVTMSTWNEREVNAWKGRDEVRKSGGWAVMFNRTQVYSGRMCDDPLETLLVIRSIIQQLLNHPAFHHWTEDEIGHLEGRKVYYNTDPATITSQHIADEGRLVLTTEEGHRFAPPAHAATEEERADWDSEYGDHLTTHLLDERIWWWRD